MAPLEGETMTGGDGAKTRRRRRRTARRPVLRRIVAILAASALVASLLVSLVAIPGGTLSSLSSSSQNRDDHIPRSKRPFGPQRPHHAVRRRTADADEGGGSEGENEVEAEESSHDRDEVEGSSQDPTEGERPSSSTTTENDGGGGSDGTDSDNDNCEEEARTKPPRPYYLSLPLLIFVCLYMFLALAIACDDCFVPALEYLSSHFNLSDDVAGATLMAAGGSAPELFTSLVATFQTGPTGRDIAVGTILGSAVFNVLFVVGACALAIPSHMDVRLHPYPLLRDCSCYVVGLSSLAVFAGTTSPGKIEPWEASIMFGLYCSYVTFMAYGNGKAEAWFKSKFGGRRVHAVATSEEEDEIGDENNDSNLKIAPGSKAGDIVRNVKAMAMGGKGGGKKKQYVELTTNYASKRDLDFDVPPEDLKLDVPAASSPQSVVAPSGNALNGSATEKGLEEGFDNEGLVVGGGSSDDPEQPAGETSGEANAEEEDGKKNEDEDDDDEDDDEDGGPLLDRLWARPPPGSSCVDWISYVAQLPLVALLGFTVPYVPPMDDDGGDDDSNEEQEESNVRGKEKADDETGQDSGAHAAPALASSRGATCRAYAAFLLSILWIGTFTYVMVRSAELIGSALDVPNAVMGLTVLATGASVPDMLSAVCVAKKGRGDMAVSCTVGSNIFDLLLGLPVPWLLSFVLPGYRQKYVAVGTDDMVVSIAVLVGMLFATIGVMRCLSWRMGRGLGAAMFGMFVLFQLQAVLRELPFDKCGG